MAGMAAKRAVRWRKRYAVAGLAGLSCLASQGAPALGGTLEQTPRLARIEATATSDEGADTAHDIPYFPSGANARGWQGFVRVANHSDDGGTVSIRAFDDAGHYFGPLTLELDPGETAHFNSGDLEEGNASKGLTGRTGRLGQGDWRLVLASDLRIDAMAYVRTSDGLLTAMHDVAPTATGAGNAYRVVTLNPGSNHAQESLLRLVNPGRGEAAITIRGVDDRGDGTGPVRLRVAAGASRTISAAELEEGVANLEGTLGDGVGKWRLKVESDLPVRVMSLLASPTGHLTNLSTVPIAAAGATAHDIPFFPAAGNPRGWQGFVRIANHSNEDGMVSIRAFDDAGRDLGTLRLAVDAGETVHFNSGDLEDGNGSKGLTGSTGRPSQGDWRLELESALPIEAMAYVRTSDGLLTAMHDIAPEGGGDGNAYRVVAFNPGSNRAQESLLRLANSDAAEAAVTIRAVDDRGISSGPVRLKIAARGSRTVSALELEEGAGGLEGALGDGGGKWRLDVESDMPLLAMSLLASPTGHLTNLSTVPAAVLAGDYGGGDGGGTTEPPQDGDCYVGLLVSPGESCTYPGTNDDFTVTADGRGWFLFFTSEAAINITHGNFSFAASHQDAGVWRIDRVGGSTTPPGSGTGARLEEFKWMP